MLKIVFIWSIVSVPGDNIKKRMIHFSREKFSNVLVDYGELFILIFIPGSRDLEVSWICASICSNRSKIWDYKMTFINFYKPTSYISFTFNSKFNSSLDDCYFFGIYVKYSIFSLKSHFSFLWYKKHISIRIVESFIFHRCVKSK